jgi:hypothetical protein
MFCPSKLIRTCSASLIYHFPPQSALDTTAIILLQMQSTQRQHTTPKTASAVAFEALYAGPLPEVSSSPEEEEEVSFANCVSSLLQLRPQSYVLFPTSRQSMKSPNASTALTSHHALQLSWMNTVPFPSWEQQVCMRGCLWGG